MFRINNEQLELMNKTCTEIKDVDLHVIKESIHDFNSYLNDFRDQLAILEKIDTVIKDGSIRFFNLNQFNDLKIAVFDAKREAGSIKYDFANLEDKLQEVMYEVEIIEARYKNEQRDKNETI